jgi:hypothetical protein
MKITKQQLQQLVKEEISNLKEDPEIVQEAVPSELHRALLRSILQELKKHTQILNQLSGRSSGGDTYDR